MRSGPARVDRQHVVPEEEGPLGERDRAGPAAVNQFEPAVHVAARDDVGRVRVAEVHERPKPKSAAVG